MPAPRPEQVVARWWNEVLGESRLELIDELVAEPYVSHSLDVTKVRSRDQLRADLVQFQRALHQPVTTIDDQAVVGDTVWSRLTSRGVNIDSAEPVTIRWLTVTRVVDGRLTESWVLHAPGVDWNDGS